MVDSYVPIRWKLKEFLDSNGITVYRLAQETESKISRTRLYQITRQEAKGVHFETLNTLIPVLEQLTGRQVELSDLLEYQR